MDFIWRGVDKIPLVRELNFELINLNLIMCDNYAIDSICYVMCVMRMSRIIISQNLRKGHVTVEVLAETTQLDRAKRRLKTDRGRVESTK